MDGINGEQVEGMKAADEVNVPYLFTAVDIPVYLPDETMHLACNHCVMKKERNY